jgi:hypothetical protein
LETLYPAWLKTWASGGGSKGGTCPEKKKNEFKCMQNKMQEEFRKHIIVTCS